MKNIFFLGLIFLCISTGCKKASFAEEIQMNDQKTFLKSIANDPLYHNHDDGNGNGKFGCIPNAAIELENDKFFTVNIAGDTDNKEYIFFKYAYIHTLNDLGEIVNKETKFNIYLECTNEALQYWNGALPGRVLNKIQVGVCSSLIPHSTNTSTSERFIYKRGAVFQENHQLEPHNNQCDCYVDCYYKPRPYWN